MNGPRIIGLDIGKTTIHGVIIDSASGKLSRFTSSTNFAGRQELLDVCRPGDIIGLEAGNLSFLLARQLSRKCTVIVLNSGKLKIIFESLKKTDREDALKLARLIQRFPREELPEVAIPTDDEIEMRASLTEHERLTEQRTASINALHSLYWNSGVTHLKRSDLSSAKNRESHLSCLSGGYSKQADRILQLLSTIEEQLEAVEKEQLEYLQAHLDQTTISVSMPGVGPKVALALLAYLGDFSRFASARQVNNYCGFAPIVDQSGDTVRYYSISKAGPHGLRKLMVQAAWAAVASNDGGILKAFYNRLATRKGKRKAIVAVARKMLELQYAMHRSESVFRTESGDQELKAVLRLARHRIIEYPENLTVRGTPRVRARKGTGKARASKSPKEGLENVGKESRSA